MHQQATQQGAAPDRLQLRSLRSFLASVSALSTAGELGRWARLMKRDLIYRLLGYAVAAVLLRYAALQTEIWIFWSESGYLDRYFPAWWLSLAAAMALMAILLFMPAVVPQRHRGTPFVFLRLVVALFLLWFYWHWCERDGWIFHDWVAHPYLGECSGAHGGDLFLALLATAGYASLPLIGWQLSRWKEWKQTCPPDERRRTLVRRTKVAAIVAGLIVAILTVATIILVRDPQKEQREKIKSTLRARGSLFSYTAPRRVRSIPLFGGIISDLLYNCDVMEFSGILAIDEPVEDDDLRVLSGYRNLESITLTRSQVSDAGIRHLTTVPNLTWVTLTGCQLTDKCITDLINIPKLKTLFIEDTGITDRGAALIKAALPECSVFVTEKPNKASEVTTRKLAEPQR
jgi:hypothetical protein